MVDIKTRGKKPTGTVAENEAVRGRARNAFRGSVRALTANSKPFAALSALDDLEMMEAATALTRRK